MKNKTIIHITIILFFLSWIFGGCQEVFNPENLEAEKKIPVIQGWITDKPGPYKVTLRWASPFNKDEVRPIENVDQVMISDNSGNREILRNTGNGIFSTSKEGIRGKPGREYQLHVELDNGDIFETGYIKMNKKAEIDTIYAETGTKEIARRNVYGDVMVSKQEGLHLFYNLKHPGKEKKFFRVTTTIIAQSTYMKNINSQFPPPIQVYCWEKWRLDKLPAVASTHTEENYQVIKGENLGFLPYLYNPNSGTESTSPVRPQGWIVNSHIMSVSPEAYSFYTNMNEQLEAEERIFDPIPSQIKGNIKCINDPKKFALGFFEVAPEAEFNIAFRWGPYMTSLKVRNVNYLPDDIVDGCQDGYPPDFWVNFY
jgi:hypothetical protein